MRAILHIGMDKTGSSALQASLAESRDELAQRRVVYPDLDGHPDHRLLVDGDARRLIEPPLDHTLVLSFEGFFPAGPRRLDPLLRRLGPDCEIHVWVRDPGRYVDAAFRQRCREVRSERHLAALLRTVGLPSAVNPIARRCIDRYRMLTTWKAMHGARLRVHDYERDRHDIVGAFSSATGIDLQRREHRRNQSPSLRALHALALERSTGRNPDPTAFVAAAVEFGEVATAPLVPERVSDWCRVRTARLLEEANIDVPLGETSASADRNLDRESARRLADRIRNHGV